MSAAEPECGWIHRDNPAMNSENKPLINSAMAGKVNKVAADGSITDRSWATGAGIANTVLIRTRKSVIDFIVDIVMLLLQSWENE